jgi:hypothetical protein
MKKLIDLLTRKLGRPTVRSDWSEYEFECPKCGKPKLGVNLRKSVFNCFRCRWGGHLEKLLLHFGVSLHSLAEEVLATRPRVVSVPNRDARGVIPGFMFLNAEKALASQTRVDCVSHVKSRLGLSGVDVLKYFGSKWGISSDYALSQRLVIPVLKGGEVVQFLARRVVDWVEPKEKSGFVGWGWSPKAEVCYGLDDVPARSDVVVVEGVWDAEAIRLRGPSWAFPCALLGSSMSEAVCGQILARKPRSVTFFLDGDHAGLEGTTRAVYDVWSRDKGVEVRVARPPAGKDPKDMDHGSLVAALENSLPASCGVIAVRYPV